MDKLRRHGCFHFKMGGLPQGMHPAVRAAGSLAMDFLFKDVFQFFFQVILDGTKAKRLGLPAAKSRAIVFQGEFKFT